MKKIMNPILYLLILLASMPFAKAQEVSALLKLDTNQLKLGEQTRVQLILKRPLKLHVKWPVIPDTLGKVEVLQKLKKDTLSKDANSITERQSFTITAFDSGFYVIPPFIFGWKQLNDTTNYHSETEALLLSVKTVSVDTTKNFRDIKKPLEVPFNWLDAWPYFAGGIGLILVILLIIYLLKNRKKPLLEIISKTPKRAAHEIAFEALKSLEQEKLWQQGSIKAYYISISDILRTYIEDRYQVQALEQTTDETMQSLRKINLSIEVESELKAVLQLSDLVKFAKLQPIGLENDNSMKQAYDFVKKTMQENLAINKEKEEMI